MTLSYSVLDSDINSDNYLKIDAIWPVNDPYDKDVSHLARVELGGWNYKGNTYWQQVQQQITHGQAMKFEEWYLICNSKYPNLVKGFVQGSGESKTSTINCNNNKIGDTI